MADSMVTGRMPAEKKEAGNRVLAAAGIKPSQAIGLMYDRLIETRDAGFLTTLPEGSRASSLASASLFVDSLVEKRASRFDDMTPAQIKRERLAARGLMDHA